MVQDPLVKDLAQDVARDEAEVRVEAEWAVLFQQDRVEIVSVQAVERRLFMLPDSLVMQKAVLNVARK